jgi:tetratricopeptide (TPR) repeat protein
MAIVLIVAVVTVIEYVRGWRGPALALAFFAGTILPALGFFNVYPMLFSFVADHFAYLASLGVIALVVGALAKTLRSPQRLGIVAGIVLPALIALSMSQAATYHDAETVWRDTLTKHPDAWMPRNNLAQQLIRRAAASMEAGDRSRADVLLGEARTHVDRALELRPEYRQALSTKADLLRLEGLYEEALAFAQAALARIEEHQERVIVQRGLESPTSPPRALAHWEVGRLQELLKRSDEALQSYRTAIRWEPSNAMIHGELFRFLRWTGEQANRSGQYAAAIAYFRELSTLARTDEQRIDAAYRLAQLLAMCPDADLRRPDEAIRLALQANEIATRTNASSPYILAVLAAAYASAGNFEHAVRFGEQAAAMARTLGLDIAAEFDRQVQAYRQGQSAP